jgi:superfamily I DNA and/or RNA helicase
MDEASQMKPEEALGVIARGKQVVIVGDPKQLPPTSFFDRAVSEEGDDNTAIEESESILDAALPMFLARRLRWHYRSQHESLIAFSNHSFL